MSDICFMTKFHITPFPALQKLFVPLKTSKSYSASCRSLLTLIVLAAVISEKSEFNFAVQLNFELPSVSLKTLKLKSVIKAGLALLLEE